MKGLALGSKEFVRFFRLLGFVGMETTDRELLKVIREAVRSGYGIVLVDYSLASAVEDEVRRISAESPVPIVTLSPPFKVRETPERIKEEVIKSLRLG